MYTDPIEKHDIVHMDHSTYNQTSQITSHSSQHGQHDAMYMYSIDKHDTMYKDNIII